MVSLFQKSFGDEMKKKMEELADELTKLKQKIELEIESADNYTEKLFSLMKSKAAQQLASEETREDLLLGLNPRS